MGQLTFPIYSKIKNVYKYQKSYVESSATSICKMREIGKCFSFKNKSRFFTFCTTVIPLDIKRQIESWEKVNTKIKI